MRDLAVEVGNNTGIKFLGVPAYQLGTGQKWGDLIADNTMQLLQTWNCNGSVINMTFDTTPSNTGQVSDACVSLQLRIGLDLLWFAYHHHMEKLFLPSI